ncbi:acyltransferase [Psychroserpens jangbogonensis]|uniref:acyltransferase n=1 Tax=Psychroserpens jangbogonensis TaxID=1484460 RepID=UPI0006898BD5|nr:acyltransferase [Psychroserpens jangbogonensis]
MAEQLYKIRMILRNLLFKFKGALLKSYLRINNCEVTGSIKCKQFPVFRTIPKGNIKIGKNVTIGYRITFDVSNSGMLKIGNHTTLTQDIIISSNKSVEIGNNTLIAENVSIRDSDHGTKKINTINSQELVSLPIQVKDDVWIGAGVRVLKGSLINKGCVIAANSVVLSKNKTLEYHIYGGAPIKRIGERI